MSAITLPYALYLAASLNAALLGFALVYQAITRRAAAHVFAGALLITAAAAIGLISLDHAGALDAVDFWHYIEGALSLLAGVFLAALIQTITMTPLRFFALILAGAICGATVAFAANGPATFLNAAVIAQMAYTLFSWIVLARAKRRSVGTGRAFRRRLHAAFKILLAISALHLAQLFRIAAPDVAAAEDIVPILSAAAFIGLTVVIFAGARNLVEIRPVPQARADTNERLAARLEKLLADDALYKNPKLKLADVAQSLGVPAAVLSRTINAQFDLTFSEYVAAKRLAEAVRLLTAPRETRTSVEAIGLLAGFGSRSSFYSAFKNRYGVSPAQFRQSGGKNPS